MSVTVSGQRFDCDGQSLVAANNGKSTTIFRPLYIPFSPPFFSPVSKYQNNKFDALGFNSMDNYIYAIEDSTNNIVRLKRGSSFEIMGQVDLVDTLNADAGDCTVDGLYMIYERSLNEMLVYKVIDGLEFINRFELYWGISSGNNGRFETRIFDFAIDPNNPSVAYAYQGIADHPDLLPESTRGFMLKIDIDLNSPSLGMVSKVGLVDKTQLSHLGGILFSPQSEVFGYGTSSDGYEAKQNEFISINPFGGDVRRILTDFSVIKSDGCSCPFSLTFTNSVPTTGILCSNDAKEFILTINNNSFGEFSGVTLRDTLPIGIIIDRIEGLDEENLGIIYGIGTNILEITNFTIPPKSEINIIIKAQSIDAQAGEAYNQAFLYGLPERFGSVLPSDDPATPGDIGDSNLFPITAPKLDDATFDFVLPSNCLEADDGRITVTSPNLIPNQAYEIRLRNQVDWGDFSFAVTVDGSNSFTIDSLLPGKYRMYEVRPVETNCSFTIKDTVIVVEPPNDLLELTISSNDPLCEGDDLQLSSEIFPGGEITWRGPSIFGSIDDNPLITNTATTNGGVYTAVAEYGYCRQTDTLPVTIHPKVMLQVTGDSILCERDQLSITARGKGKNVVYIWSDSKNFSVMDSTLFISSIEESQSGIYTVTASNEGCSDSSEIVIEVLNTPSISLPEEISSDFCTPIILNPEIKNKSDITYQWLPSVGLSCYDCEYPSVLPIVQTEYKIIGRNANGCADSSQVSIILDKEKIVTTPNIMCTNSTVGNDIFNLIPACLVLEIQQLSIFDKWGNVVFQTRSSSTSELAEYWDGYLNGKAVATGVYIWSARVILVDGSTENITGDVTVIRSSGP